MKYNSYRNQFWFYYYIFRGGDSMYSALDIAKWFLAKNHSENRLFESAEELYEGISHLKLQKLLYYAEGIYLALNDSKLFKEDIIAWQHGPVISSVYEEYKKFGKDFIVFNADESDVELIDRIENDEKAIEALELTYNSFAIYTAWQLRNMTHEKNSPWDVTVSQKGLSSVIDSTLIKEYFRGNIFEN